MERADLAELLKIKNVCHALSSRYKETTEEIRILTESEDDLDFYSIRDSINDLLDITTLIYQSTDKFKNYLENHIFEGDLICSTVHAMEFDILNPQVSETLGKNYTMFKDILDNIQNKIGDDEEYEGDYYEDY